jgi:hypothetical protein
LNRPMPPYCIFPSFTLSRTVSIPPATFGAVCLLITQTTPQGFELKTDMNRPDHIALGALSSSSTRKNFTPPQASSRLGVHQRGIDVHLRRQDAASPNCCCPGCPYYSSDILVPGNRSGFEELWQASTNFCCTRRKCS